jgi:acetolactate synthase I/II/III large subunit
MGIIGADIVAQTLGKLGVKHTFGICGHGNLTLLDSLLDTEIEFISTYHEQVATHAADAYYRVSGKPGVVITTIGPGLTNTITGLLDAQMDSSAVIVIAGDVPVDYVGKGALQELQLHEDASQTQIFKPFTKKVFRPLTVDQIPDMLVRAFHTATSGCPGPVLVSIPLDLYSNKTDINIGNIASRHIGPQRIRGDLQAIQKAGELLINAEKPLIYAGGGVNISEANQELLQLCEYLGIPVSTTMIGQGAISEDHPLAAGFTGTVGTPIANGLIKEADVVLAIGTGFSEMDANSWQEDYFIQTASSKLIHVDIDPLQIGKIYDTEVAIVGDAKAILTDLVADIKLQIPPRAWGESAYIESFTKKRNKWKEELTQVQLSNEAPMQPATVLREVRNLLPRDGILVSGVGIRHAVGQHFPIYGPKTHIVGSGFGTMGQEMPAPIGAKLACPDKQVIAVVGDGAFHSLPNSIGTAAKYKVPVIWVVLNNNGYASIAIYQSKHFGRHNSTYFSDIGKSISEPDTLTIAKAYGVSSISVKTFEELKPALEKAVASNEPFVIDVQVTQKPSIRSSGHWDVNDILARGSKLSK